MSRSEAAKLQAAQAKENFGADYHAVIGARGGRKGRTGGFYGDPERASRIGKLGAQIKQQRKMLA